MSFIFNEHNQAKIATLLTQYPDKKALSLPMLWMAQYQDGWITPDAMRHIALRLDLSVSEVYAIASFYTMFKLSPIGTYHIEVCKTLSCDLCGKSELLEHLRTKWNLTPGQTTEDGKFTLSLVECMGACGGAPMITLNETYHEHMSVEKIDQLLEALG